MTRREPRGRKAEVQSCSGDSEEVIALPDGISVAVKLDGPFI